MVKFSFYKMKYVGARKFVGLDNYRAIFKRDDIIGALKLCLYYMAGALIQLAIALYLATILSMKVKCSNLFKGFMFFPYLIDGIASDLSLNFSTPVDSYLIPFFSGVDSSLITFRTG